MVIIGDVEFNFSEGSRILSPDIFYCIAVGLNSELIISTSLIYLSFLITNNVSSHVVIFRIINRKSVLLREKLSIF